jgi:CheY-like chemotaxis protein
MDQQRKTILIVDDDEQVLIELEHLLEDQGYNTTTAWSGHEALQLLQQRSFDFILMDGDLSDLTRDDLIRQAKQSSKATWIILHPQARFRPESLGANSVCKTEHAAILSRLRECLSRRQHPAVNERTGTLA